MFAGIFNVKLKRNIIPFQIRIVQIELRSKATPEVSLADSQETFQICRVRKNNRHVLFYIGEGSSLRAGTTLRIWGVVFTFKLESVEGFESWNDFNGLSMSLNSNWRSKLQNSMWRIQNENHPSNSKGSFRP